jgi:hypothetical protein
MSESLESIWNDINQCSKHAPDLCKAAEVLLPLRPFLESQELPVRYLLVALEPSVRKKPPSDRQKKRAEMALNFNSTGGDFAIRSAARKWLVDEGEGFYITDLAKCKIAVKDAPPTRELRVENCRPFLSREVALFSKTLRAIIPVGKESRRFLQESKSKRSRLAADYQCRNALRVPICRHEGVQGRQERGFDRRRVGRVSRVRREQIE